MHRHQAGGQCRQSGHAKQDEYDVSKPHGECSSPKSQSTQVIPRSAVKVFKKTPIEVFGTLTLFVCRHAFFVGWAERRESHRWKLLLFAFRNKSTHRTQ